MIQLDGDDSQTSSLYEKATTLMKAEASNEGEPFKEKYEARGYLEICLALLNGPSNDQVLGKALCQHKLGLIGYEVEEFSTSHDHMQKSLELFQSLPQDWQY